MSFVSLRKTLLLFSVCFCRTLAQDPVGVLEGLINDPSGATVSRAEVTLSNPHTGFSTAQKSTSDGLFHFASLPVGEYELRVSAEGFAAFTASSIRIDIGRTVRIPVKLEVAAGHSEVNVIGTGAMVDLGPTLGNVVSEHETADLPLNGRNFTQLGLLQPGVAPLTGGLAEAGGLARANQAYAVNGQRPESNGICSRCLQHRPRQRRICHPRSRRCHCRVSHLDIECARRIRRHERRHHERGD
jgi:hypothetical protein